MHQELVFVLTPVVCSVIACPPTSLGARHKGRCRFVDRYRLVQGNLFSGRPGPNANALQNVLAAALALARIIAETCTRSRGWFCVAKYFLRPECLGIDVGRVWMAQERVDGQVGRIVQGTHQLETLDVCYLSSIEGIVQSSLVHPELLLVIVVIVVVTVVLWLGQEGHPGTKNLARNRCFGTIGGGRPATEIRARAEDPEKDKGTQHAEEAKRQPQRRHREVDCNSAS
mmetsp:Transcript_5578/g.16059  ORF Transcript_5578/g.16059 Transcript_5578/m.16059 type:complete len:228 (+) Transcript_5578:1444-2127(+)